MSLRLSIGRRGATLFAAFAVVALALAPALAEARAGGRISSGSRGSQTQSAPPATQTAPGGAQQMQRTQTPATQPGTPAAAPGAAARPGAPAAAPGGFFARNPMMAGLMGGLLGAGLFGMLAGSGFFGGMAGLAGFFGLLLQIALIGGIIWLVLRLVRGARRPAMAGGPAAGPAPGPMGLARDMNPGGRPSVPSAGGTGGMAMGAGAASAVTRTPVEIKPADYEAFERMLLEVQEAWSQEDMSALRRLSTPEMEAYFRQDLEDLKARGWKSVSKDVQLEAGDLSEAWAENGQDYATVAMRFSLIDLTTDAEGKVVEGHPTERDTATEFWTFTRRPGTQWVLSAIQQTG